MYRPFPLFIGLRYTRARRRNHFISFITVISLLGIILGVTALITVLSVMNGFHKEVRSRILGMASHAEILSVSGGLKDWPSAVAQAKADERVVGAAPFVDAQVMLINGQNVSGAIVRGILPEQEPEVSDVGDKMVAGRLTDLRVGEYGIILGRELANVLNVNLGDGVTVVTPQITVTPAGTVPRMKRFTVVGMFEVGMGEYDRGVALVHLRDGAVLQRLDDAVSGVRLKLHDMDLAPLVSRDMARQWEGMFRVLDWTQSHRNFFAALKTEKRMMGLILFLIVAVAAFNIVSTLVMVVTDKRSDIAILRTLGASPLEIMGIFVVQGTWIGFAGTLLGVVGGVALALNVETVVGAIERQFGIHFIDPSIYYISKLPSDLHWNDVGLIGGVAFVLTVLATLYPAWRASRVQPAEALRYE
ncbi:MAG: lipoprotein-releasing ABC transporter permease subunit [Acetobacteraceae bacterium]|jgi:lipoprotein-releasing system permease protein|nr:lipoprotein-releasing ABC transporter permease subunit [Acetobacteraceae bacterium]